MTKSVVSKILADPILFLRTRDDDEAASAISRLFGLPDEDTQVESEVNEDNAR
jgi:hypothetical protein